MRTSPPGRRTAARVLALALLMPASGVVALATAAPAAAEVFNLQATANIDEVELTWYGGGPGGTVVRGKPGAVAPTGPTDGFDVPTNLSVTPSAVATGLAPGQPYSFAVFPCNTPTDCGEPSVVTVGSYTVTASTSRDRATYGQEVQIVGRVVDTITGAPVEFADIRILAHPPGRPEQSAPIGEDFSRTDGRFTIPFAPPQTLQFAVVAIGDASHLAGVGVTRAVSVSSAVYLEPVPKKGKLGTRFILIGGADPIATGTPLVLQKKVRTKWKTVLKQRPNRNGITRFKVTPPTKGKHIYRVTKAATPGVGGGTSRQVTITVT